MTTYSVPDISCDHCVRAITEALRPLDGVTGVEVSIDAKSVTVTGSAPPAAVAAAIADAGYAVEG